MKIFLLLNLSDNRPPIGPPNMLANMIRDAIFGGPIGGRLSDKFRRRKIFIFVPGILTSLGVILFGISQPRELWLLIPLVGFLDSIVFSTMYASASQYPEVGREYAPLGISIINSGYWLALAYIV